MAGRIALITGASRGIGRAAAVALAAAGHHVILVARTVGGLEETDDAVQAVSGEGATLVPLNLRDGDALDRLGASIFERWGKLDAFFGNAGVLGALTPVTHLDTKIFDELVGVNITANWRLIRSLDPLLRRSEAGRVLFASSGLARAPRPFWGGYAMTKAALESLALTYAAECADTKLRVNILNPGATRTAMRAKAMPGEDPSTLPTPEEIAPLIVQMLSPEWGLNGELIEFRKWKLANSE